MKENKKAIGIIDSGIGGLTVLEELVKRLPNEKYLYIADQRYCPYSNLENNFIKRRLLQLCKYLEKKDTKLIILACNTASIFIDYLKKNIKIPIITVITPTCKDVIRNTKNKNVGLLATKTTIESKVYQKKLQKENINTYSVACSEFVNIVEENEFNTIQTKNIIEEKVNKLLNKNIDTLVYGCTHFGLLHEYIKPYFKNVKFVSSKKATAIFVMIYLRALGLTNSSYNKTKIIIKTTNNKRKIKRQLKIFCFKKYKIRKLLF